MVSRGWNSTKLTKSLPFMVRVCESNNIFRTFVRPSCYLFLVHWAEFNQTFFITSPYGKGVREQCFYMRPSFRISIVRPSVRHAISYIVNHRAEFNQICYIRFESNIIFPCVRRPSRYRLQNYWAGFNRTCYMTFSHSEDAREQVCQSASPIIWYAISIISNEREALWWRAFDCAF